MISAVGIYVHAVFVTLSLGLPWIILAFLLKFWKNRDEDFFDGARTLSGVLGLNFALGAITGTLVEFGLVQAWPGSVFVIATFGFVPLTLELLAFVGEVVFLVLFIVTLGRVKPILSVVVMGLYVAMAVFSGAVITAVNSWLNVPWGTGDVAATIYPFIPQFGPSLAEIPAILRLKAGLLRRLIESGTASQVLQEPSFARDIGLTLRDPFAAFYSPYAVASMLHNVNAGTIVGISFGLVGYSYRFFKTGKAKYLKFIRSFLPILFLLLIIQPTILGDYMGKTVAAYQPTKFALMEKVQVTRQDPLVAFLAYGDPDHPIFGFESFRKNCELSQDRTLGDLLSPVLQNYEIGSESALKLREICLSDLDKAQDRIGLINAAYYTKIVTGVLALGSLLTLMGIPFRFGPLSGLADRLSNRLGRRRFVLGLSLSVLTTATLSAVLGWFVRDAGRKPWTVYGLLYPQELLTPVPIDQRVLLLFTMTFIATAIVGAYGMYVVASRQLRFLELLKKGAGVE